MWSERLAPSYYSKGPGVAVAIRISTTLFGDTALGVRFFSALLGLGTSVILYTLATSLYNDKVAAWAIVVLNLTPIFNAGSTLMTIDPLMIFFWCGSMLTFWRALHRTSTASDRYWLATGLLVGLGFLCKYTCALQLLSMALLLGLSRRWRGQLGRKGFYKALAVFLICTIPVLIWNAQHHWITVTHLKERAGGDESGGLHLSEFGEFLGMHFGVYSPILFVGLLWALYRTAGTFLHNDAERFLAAFTFPILAMYFALSFREAGEANWTAPGFLSAGILLAHFWDTVRLAPGWKRGLQNSALFTAGAISCVALHTDIVRQLGIPWPYHRDPSYRLRGWEETAEAVEDITQSILKDQVKRKQIDNVFLIANRWQVASELSFYMRDDLAVIRPNPKYPLVHTIQSPLPEHQFSFWPRYDGIDIAKSGDSKGTSPAVREPGSPFLGQTALYITDDSDRQNPPKSIQSTFEKFHLIRIMDVLRGGNVVRRIKIFACYNYKHPPI
ncbi:MAG: glycosyltransferase family 39 protein [Verrucomicrobiae bacterium]|nr:glycosyltransferase family 39 protein [Verrucomicrobiae bacterium]